MNAMQDLEFCDVIGCRKQAAVMQASAETELDEQLCEPCYLNLAMSRPELAAGYRPLRPPALGSLDTASSSEARIVEMWWG